MSVVESSDAGQVMDRFFHNHMVLWFKVRSYVVVGSSNEGQVM